MTDRGPGAARSGCWASSRAASAGATPRATSIFSRRWPTCSPTRSSARRPRTGSATARCTTRSPACPTGCCSSTGSSTRSRGCARRGSLAAILFLDLDRFKLVNDSLGHQVGDELLAAAAPRLKQAVRASDTVARFGGDEFGILLEDIADEHDAIEMAERIAVGVHAAVRARRQRALRHDQHRDRARPRRRAAPTELIRDADAAMYRAKERGSARYELFDEAMRDRAMARLRVENDLRRALERDELRLDYQPVVSLRDHTIVGVEALVRWEHPERGLIAPDEFIPVAEEDGLIEPIGGGCSSTRAATPSQWHRRLAGRRSDRDRR